MTRAEILAEIDYHRYWNNGFFNTESNHSKWDDWYINPGDGYIFFGDDADRKRVMPQAIKLCDTTEKTFETLSDESLADCLKYMNKQRDSKTPL